MRRTINFPKVKTSLKSLFALVAIVITAAACTKHKSIQNNVGPDAYVAKSELQGKTFHLVRGIIEADSDNTVEAIPGTSRDFGLVTVEVTENELRLLTAFDPSGRKETAKVIASYPIKDHFDIVNDKNDFDEKTNKVIEDKKRPWDQRQFMRVDWANPSNSMSSFLSQLGGSQIEEMNTVLKEGLKNENGHYSWVVETGIQGHHLMRYLPPFGEEAVSAFRVTYRTHLMPVKESDFKPIDYSLKDFGRFGYFATQQNILNPEQELRDKDLKIYANVFNVCESGRAGSCSTNKITWVLSKDFPAQYRDTAQETVNDWNQVFKEALNRTDDVVVLDTTVQADISDPRYNIIAYYPSRTNAGLLGIAQWVSDPRTGELKSARATIYGDGINYELGVADTAIDIITAVDKSADPLKEVFGVDSLGASLLSDSSTYDVGTPRQAQTDMRRVLDFDHPRAQRYDYLGSMINMAGVKQAGATGGTAKSIPTFLQGSATSLGRFEIVQKSAPALMSVPFIDSLNSVTGKPEQGEAASAAASGTASDATANIGSKLSVARMVKITERIQAEKKAHLLQSANGIHGSELVEDAVVNFLVKKANALNKKRSLKIMSDSREKIKAEIAKEVFKMTLLHEMGHTFGLRHNFAGSADKQHYYPEFQALYKRMKSGDKSVTEADLAPYEFSSVMDYGGEFFSQKGGLGPYDKAAIKYAYNRSVNKESAEFVRADGKGQYMFCTDHQVGESLLCDRFDRGSTISEVTENRIEKFHKSWALKHFRRGRVEFDGWANYMPDYLIGSTFIPIRKTMDEFMYSIVSAKRDGSGGACPMQFFRDSINAGEAANVCNVAEAKAVGVDPTDVTTFTNAILDKDGFYRVPRAGDLIPYGLADHLRANDLAQRFFLELLSTVEPGKYFVKPSGVKGQPATLIALDMTLNSDEERLRKVAPQVHVDEKTFPTVVDKMKTYIGEVKINRFARPYTTRFKNEGTFSHVESVGSEMDKLGAIIALSLPSLGVDKYAAISFSGSPYIFPQSSAYMSQLFNKMITGSLLAPEVLLKMADGQIVVGQSNAAFDNTLQRFASVFAMTLLVSDIDGSMAEKLQVCIEGESGCGGSKLVPSVQATSASGGRTYVASQNLEGDSIAFDLVSSMKKISDPRDALSVRGADPVKSRADDAALLASVSDARLRIVGATKDFPEITDLQAMFSDAPANEAGANTKGFAELVKLLADAPSMDPQAVIDQGRAIFSDLNDARDKVAALILDLGNKGLCNEGDEQSKAACLTSAEGARRARLTQISADIAIVINAAGTVADNEIQLMQVKPIIKDASDQIKSQESIVLLLRRLSGLLGN